MTLRHAPRLGANRPAVLLKASMSGLGACTRKQSFATPASNQPERNSPTVNRPQLRHDPLIEGRPRLLQLVPIQPSARATTDEASPRGPPARHWAGRRRTLSAMATWPATAHELIQLQQALGEMTPERWQPPTTLPRIGACFVCFEPVQGAGATGDAGFAGAAMTYRRRLLAGVSVSGPAGGPYLPALLALREGPLLEQAVRALPIAPEVLVVNATGRDHPRRAGLALHLGVVLGLPTVGVTTRPLLADGPWPADQRGAMAPLLLDGEVVGCWVRTRAKARPVAVHAAWRTDAQAAVQVVLAATRRARTPEPLRRARTLARIRRAHSR
jgi:deoxyribonuclease V